MLCNYTKTRCILWSECFVFFYVKPGGTQITNGFWRVNKYYLPLCYLPSDVHNAGLIIWHRFSPYYLPQRSVFCIQCNVSHIKLGVKMIFNSQTCWTSCEHVVKKYLNFLPEIYRYSAFNDFHKADLFVYNLYEHDLFPLKNISCSPFILPWQKSVWISFIYWSIYGFNRRVEHRETLFKIATTFVYFDTQHPLCFTVHALDVRKQQNMALARSFWNWAVEKSCLFVWISLYFLLRNGTRCD